MVAGNVEVVGNVAEIAAGMAVGRPFVVGKAADKVDRTVGKFPDVEVGRLPVAEVRCWCHY